MSVLKKLVVYTKTTVAEQDTDVTSAGKTIGFDELYATQTGKTTGKAQIAYAEHGGLLYGTLILTHNGALAHGTVTGGTGTFTGATGTITVKPANKSGTHSAVTITYTTWRTTPAARAQAKEHCHGHRTEGHAGLPRRAGPPPPRVTCCPVMHLASRGTAPRPPGPPQSG